MSTVIFVSSTVFIVALALLIDPDKAMFRRLALGRRRRRYVGRHREDNANVLAWRQGGQA